MNYLLLFLMVLFNIIFSINAQAQNWSTFLDPSRAINWTSAGFTIPNYTVNCSTQPTLQTGTSNAAANTTAIENALASCDATHNVVNLPSGTYYVNGWVTDGYNHTVVRGAGPKSTYIYLQTNACGGTQAAGVCLESSDNTFDGSSSVLPPSGAHQCLWTGGLSQGSTTITLSSCGSAPPVNNILILDQANDTTDTSGVFICDAGTTGCSTEVGVDSNGRTISGSLHSEQQVTYIIGVTSQGGGTYAVTISPSVYFQNIRAGQSPGAWWFTNAVNNGLENLTLDGTNTTSPHNMNVFNCYQCWIKNVRSINPYGDHVFIYQSGFGVIRDSYFYQGQNHGSEAYAVEFEIGSGFLVENNIFQQTTNPIMFGGGTGNVISYNYEIDNVTTGTYSLQTAYASHNAGNTFNLWEGNNFIGVWTDPPHGTSANETMYRNLLHGWQGGATYAGGYIPLEIRTYQRAFNVVGNVLGHPGTQNQYEAYATSTSGGSGTSNAATSIYEVGWADIGGWGNCGSGGAGSPYCDALAHSSLMRWGNYDTVNAATQWNSTEASPSAVTYVNANFTSSYFGTLAHTLPNSLHYSSTPGWWGSVAWPPIGPDVSSGNVGVCSGGTYSGYQATSAGKCTGGTLSTAWASHVNAIPAQVCYLNVMNGPADGSGSVLSFDASQCYGSSGTSGGGTPPAPPSGLTTTVN